MATIWRDTRQGINRHKTGHPYRLIKTFSLASHIYALTKGPISDNPFVCII